MSQGVHQLRRAKQGLSGVHMHANQDPAKGHPLHSSLRGPSTESDLQPVMSLVRTFRNFQAVGFKEWFRQMTYIGDAKAGRLVGTDKFGNRYFENLDPAHEVPGRHRWVDYAQDDFNASQVPPEWHSWIGHIRHLPPTEDPIIAASTPPWLAPFRENLTGTRAAYKSYSTTVPKINAWEPKVKSRSG